MKDKAKAPVGRPRKHQMPERVDASPEEIARVFMAAKPKNKWRYMQEADEKDGRG